MIIKHAAGSRLIELPSDISSHDAKSFIHSIVRQYLTLNDTEKLKFDIEMLYIEKENEYIQESIQHAKEFNDTLQLEWLI